MQDRPNGTEYATVQSRDGLRNGTYASPLTMHNKEVQILAHEVNALEVQKVIPIIYLIRCIRTLTLKLN